MEVKFYGLGLAMFWGVSFEDNEMKDSVKIYS